MSATSGRAEAGGGTTDETLPENFPTSEIPNPGAGSSARVSTSMIDAIFRQQATKFLIWGIGIGGFIALHFLRRRPHIVNTLGVTRSTPPRSPSGLPPAT